MMRCHRAKVMAQIIIQWRKPKKKIYIQIWGRLRSTIGVSVCHLCHTRWFCVLLEIEIRHFRIPSCSTVETFSFILFVYSTTQVLGVHSPIAHWFILATCMCVCFNTRFAFWNDEIWMPLNAKRILFNSDILISARTLTEGNREFCGYSSIRLPF